MNAYSAAAQLASHNHNVRGFPPQESGATPLKRKPAKIFQLNIGLFCNQARACMGDGASCVMPYTERFGSIQYAMPARRLPCTVDWDACCPQDT